MTHWPVGSSVHRPNAQFLRSFPDAEKLFGVREVQTMTVQTLDDVAQRENLLADCLKIDVEGAALDVLIGAEKSLQNTLVLEVEAEVNPLFEDEALFSEVDSHLRERGWVLQGPQPDELAPGRSPRAFGQRPGQADCRGRCALLKVLGADLSVHRELKLLVILAAHLQTDAVLDRLRSSPLLAVQLDARERNELEGLLAPRPGQMKPWRGGS